MEGKERTAMNVAGRKNMVKYVICFMLSLCRRLTCVSLMLRMLIDLKFSG